MTDISTILIQHLSSLYPHLSSSDILLFVQQYVYALSSYPTQDDLAIMEESFLVYLTSLNHHTIDQQKTMEKDDNAIDQQKKIEHDTTGGMDIDRTMNMMNVIEISFKDRNKYVHLCNIMYRGIELYTQDSGNLLYSVIPIRYEDIENNNGIYIQLSYICIDYSISIDDKEKGIFMRFNSSDKRYIDDLKTLMNVLKRYKNDSIISYNNDNKNNKKIDHNKERVEAYLEAKRLRAIVANNIPEAMLYNNDTNYPDIDHDMYNDRGIEYPLRPTSYNNNANQVIENRLKYTIDDRQMNDNRNSRNTLSHNNQLEEYRNRCKWNNHGMVQQRNNMMTWSQMNDKIDLEDQEILGRQCLEHTNIFRSKHGKQPLVWEKLMFNIGLTHSKNMGDGLVAFGHDGFQKRSKDMPFSKRSTGENVAYIYGCSKNEIAMVKIV